MIDTEIGVNCLRCRLGSLPKGRAHPGSPADLSSAIRDATREVAVLFQLSDLHLKEDATHPVQTALSLACLENFNAALASMNNAISAGDQGATLPLGEAERRVKQSMESMLCSLNIVTELMSWVYTPNRPV